MSLGCCRGDVGSDEAVQIVDAEGRPMPFASVRLAPQRPNALVRIKNVIILRIEFRTQKAPPVTRLERPRSPLLSHFAAVAENGSMGCRAALSVEPPQSTAGAARRARGSAPSCATGSAEACGFPRGPHPIAHVRGAERPTGRALGHKRLRGRKRGSCT